MIGCITSGAGFDQMGYEGLRLKMYRLALRKRGEAGYFTTRSDLATLANVRPVTAHTQFQQVERADQLTSDQTERLRVFALADEADPDFSGIAQWDIGDVFFRKGDYNPAGATPEDRVVEPPFIFKGTYLDDGPNDEQAFTVEVVRHVRRIQGRTT